MPEPMSEERERQIREDHARDLRDIETFGLGPLVQGGRTRTGAIGDLLAEIDRLRANQPPLRNEYGMRVFHVSALIEERAIADTLGGALEVLAEFDARKRPDVVSRKLRVRKVSSWGDVEEEDA